MKRLIAAVLALMMLAAFGGIFTKTVELVGADMAMDVPTGWIVLAREQEALEEGAGYFGMTAEEAAQFMDVNDFYMILYEPKSGAEIYVTIFGSQYAKQRGTFGAMNEEALEKAKADVVANYPDWVFDSEVTESSLGDFVYLACTMHLGIGEERTDNRQLYTIYNGNEIYIDLYAGDNGIEEVHVAAQDEVAASLQVDRMLQRMKMAYGLCAAVMVSLMIAVLVQFVGVAMTMLLHVRMKTDK